MYCPFVAIFFWIKFIYTSIRHVAFLHIHRSILLHIPLYMLSAFYICDMLSYRLYALQSLHLVFLHVLYHFTLYNRRYIIMYYCRILYYVLFRYIQLHQFIIALFRIVIITQYPIYHFISILLLSYALCNIYDITSIYHYIFTRLYLLSFIYRDNMYFSHIRCVLYSSFHTVLNVSTRIISISHSDILFMLSIRLCVIYVISLDTIYY